MTADRRVRVLTVLVALLALWAHAPDSAADFIWDDDSYLTGNTLISRDDGLERIWLEPTDSPQYYPMVFTTFRLEAAVWGFNPLGYRWVNVLLHLAAALLLWRFLHDVGIRGGPVAAALFALHPMTVESVAWITERKNVLAAFFMMLSLVAMARALGWTRAPARRQDHWIGLGCFVLALLSKTTVVCAPVFLWLIGEWKKTDRTTLARATAPWFVIGIVAGLHTARLESTHVGAGRLDFGLDAGQHVILAARCFWHYLSTFAWPSGLCFTPPRWSPETFAGAAWGVPTAFVLVLAAFRTSKTLWLFFVATGAALFPALGFIAVYPMRFSWVADHFAHLALIPLSVAAGLVIGRRPLIVAFVLVSCAAQSRRHGETFVDAETLWTTTLESNPDSFLANHNLGALRMARSRTADEPARTELRRHARKRLTRAAALDPADPLPHVVLGRLARDAGDRTGALTHLKAAVDLDPDHTQVRMFTARLAEDDGELVAAGKILDNLLERRPDDIRVLARLANIRWKLDDPDRAEELLLRLLALRPAPWQARFEPLWSRSAYELAWMRDRTGREGARTACELALKLDPDNAPARELMERLR